MSDGDDKKFDLGKTIGAIETNIGHIKETVEATNGKVDSINSRLIELNGSTVKQQDCTQRTAAMVGAVNELRTELARKQTRQENPAITPEMLSAPADEEVEEVEEKSWLQRAKENAAAIITIFTLIGILGAGVYKLAHFIVKVEAAFTAQAKQSEKQTKTLQQQLKKIDKPRVVYVPMPVTPDASVEPHKKRRHRRHR